MKAKIATRHAAEHTQKVGVSVQCGFSKRLRAALTSLETSSASACLLSSSIPALIAALRSRSFTAACRSPRLEDLLMYPSNSLSGVLLKSLIIFSAVVLGTTVVSALPYRLNLSRFSPIGFGEGNFNTSQEAVTTYEFTGPLMPVESTINQKFIFPFQSLHFVAEAEIRQCA